MFTGLIEGRAEVRRLEPRDKGARLVLAPPEMPPDLPPWDARGGASIAVSGCCLTLVDRTDGLAFDLSAETLDRTWFHALVPGRLVNVERSLRLSDRIGGHLVSGHVDGVGRVTAIEDAQDGGSWFTFEVPDGFERYLIEKGSVAIDGISLTVVQPAGRSFRVAIIPETLARTSLGRAEPGDAVNLEADLIGKWIERLVPGRTEATG